MKSSPAAASPYTFKQRLILAVVPRVVARLVRAWAWTWRVRLKIPRELDPRWSQQRYIYAFWHEGVVTIIPHWRDCAIQGLASQSFDGELIARTMHHFGFPPLARGSSSKGGVAALKAQVDALAAGLHVAISVDGPRGPRYKPKPGVVQLAVLSGLCIVPVSGVARPDWRLKNWDKTMVPPPFARMAFVLCQPIKVDAGGEKAALDHLEEMLMKGLKEAAAFLDD